MKNRFNFLILCVVLLMGGNAIAVAQQRVIDAVDSVAVAAATVFSEEGKFLGLTNERGELPTLKQSDYPVTVRCIGYSAVEVSSPSIDPIYLVPQCFELGEAVVTPRKPEVLQITCYARRYVKVAADTTLMEHSFGEYMLNYFIPLTKAAKKKVSSSKAYVQTSNTWTYRPSAEDGDSLVKNKPEKNNILSISSLKSSDYPMPKEIIESTDEVVTHSVPGVSGPLEVYRKSGDKLLFTYDCLADFEGGELTIPKIFTWALGVNIKFKKFYTTKAYQFAEPDTVTALSAKDLQSFSMTLDLDLSGRRVRKYYDAEHIAASVVTECYVVKKEYISIDAAVDRTKLTLASRRMNIPSSVPALDEETKLLIADVEAAK